MQQKTDFTFNGVCSFILYWAMADDKVFNVESALCQGKELLRRAQYRIQHMLEARWANHNYKRRYFPQVLVLNNRLRKNKQV